MAEPENYLLFDGECTACSRYIAATRLKSTPEFAVLDARKSPELVAELRADGYEINDGMVVRIDGQVYLGADATRKIAALAEDASLPAKGVINVIGASPWSRRLYPLLASGRRLLLKMKGRSPIA